MRISLITVDFLDEGKTVTGVYYEQVLHELLTVLQEAGKVFCFTMKMRIRKGANFRELKACPEQVWKLPSHPPYSPDPFDFFLLPKLKQSMKGKRWDSITTLLTHISSCKNVFHFQQKSLVLMHRRCIDFCNIL